MSAALLEVKHVTRRFGGFTANSDISFSVKKQEILSVIGPAGAGKSTLFKMISSLLRTTSGEVLLEGERISNLAPHMVAQKGVVRTFEETTISKNMTVRDNIIIAHHLRSKANLFFFCLGSPKAKRDEEEFTRSADEIIEFLGLSHIADELASNLSQGHLRALGIAIGLAVDPKIMLLDEPFAGMNHEETMHMLGLISSVRDRGVTVLIVEHDMSAVMKISDRVVVLNLGEMIAMGTPDEIQQDKRVMQTCLGQNTAVGF